MKTSNPKAAIVAREMGLKAYPANAEGTIFNIDCLQSDFDWILAEIEAEEAEGKILNPVTDTSAYDNLQNEGYTDGQIVDNTPYNKQD